MKQLPTLTASALIAFTMSAQAATIHKQEEKRSQPDIQIGEICYFDRGDGSNTWTEDKRLCRSLPEDWARSGLTTNVEVHRDGFLIEEFTCRPGEETEPDFLQLFGIKDPTYHPVCE